MSIYERIHKYDAKNSKAALREALHIVVSGESSGERAIVVPQFKENDKKIGQFLDSLTEEQLQEIMDSIYTTLNYVERLAVNTAYRLTPSDKRLKSVLELPWGRAQGASVVLAKELEYAHHVGRLEGLVNLGSLKQ